MLKSFVHCWIGSHFLFCGAPSWRHTIHLFLKYVKGYLSLPRSAHNEFTFAKWNGPVTATDFRKHRALGHFTWVLTWPLSWGFLEWKIREIFGFGKAKSLRSSRTHILADLVLAVCIELIMNWVLCGHVRVEWNFFQLFVSSFLQKLSFAVDHLYSWCVGNREGGCIWLSTILT